MMRFYQIIISFFLITFTHVIAQQDQIIISNAENGTTLNVLYRNDASAKIYASSRGIGFLYRRGKHVTAKSRSFYEIDAQSLRHPKELKVQGTAQDRKRFVYGKLNSIFLLRAGVGMQNTLFAKADLKAVEVRLSYSAGPVIAFAKPYYVQVFRAGNSPNADPAEVKFNSESFTQDSVVGRGQFASGLAETRFYPGVQAKLNLSFEYAPYTNLIRAIETGIFIDYLPRALPIMARNPAENIVITFHVGFVFGKKWL
jgi:hypothetical protein